MEVEQNEEVLREFRAETDEQLDSIERLLVALETDADDSESLQMLFRLVHTLKGTALMVRLFRVGALAHLVEDLLQQFVEKTVPINPEGISLLLQAVDAFRVMIPEELAGREPPPHQDLAEALRGHARSSSAQAPAAPREPVLAQPEARPSSLTEERRGRWLRVDVERLDRMLNLMGELAISHGRLAALLERNDGSAAPEAREAHRDTERLLFELQEQIMQVRMVPLGPTFRQHVRTVRDVALAQGKQARLVLEGEDVGVDTAIIESIRDPLVHMVRNAVDHGIESPEERQRQGKDPVGTLALRARHEAGRILIELSDDGAGIHRDELLARARAAGLLAEGQVPGESELLSLIFEPGLSTARSITSLSGRGVGMDVVRRNVEALRGTVSVHSREGEGTRITLALPLTLAIIEGFSVDVASQTYVLPLDAVVECVELPPGERERPRRHGVLELRGSPLPYLRLRHAFQMEDPRPHRESVVVVRYEGGQAGLVVDAFRGTGQTVIKPLPRQLQGVPGLAGAAILGDGRVALILDVVELMRRELQDMARSAQSQT